MRGLDRTVYIEFLTWVCPEGGAQELPVEGIKQGRNVFDHRAVSFLFTPQACQSQFFPKGGYASLRLLLPPSICPSALPPPLSIHRRLVAKFPDFKSILKTPTEPGGTSLYFNSAVFNQLPLGTLGAGRPLFTSPP